MNSEPLRPRFKIQKTRISNSQDDASEATEFTPEKIIYVELDNEITEIFDRVKHLRQKRIALVVPKRAILLQSIVNLKILKKKLDELEKEILIVTSDATGLQLAKKAGLTAVSKLFEKDHTQLIPEPLPPLRGQRPVRLSGEKISISQVIHQGKPSFLNSFLLRIKEKLRKKKNAAQQNRVVFITPNKQALFTLILVSILLLLAIAYIALPGATIYITPKSGVLDPSFNVSFLDYDKNRDLIESGYFNTIAIATYLVKPPPFTKKITHNATGKLFQGQNAKGVITVINLSNAPWDLAAKTRFQTEDGLVFRIHNPVRIPAAKGSTPGMLDVNAVADEFDIYGQIIGQRGNIGPSKFFLPGLKNEESRKKLYGESKLAMTGGTTQTTKTVSKEDIQAAQETAKQEITKGAVNDLKKYLEEQNIVKKTNLSLLTDRHVIKLSEPSIATPDNIVGKTTERFEITALYSASGIAFDRQQLIDALKERLLTRVDPDKKILKIEEDDIGYKFLDEDVNAGRVRLTATMRAIQVYELNPEKENGMRFLKKITDHITGMRINDAIAYLQQQTDEIERVEIKTWPIWAPTIPNIADNIKFVIIDQTAF